MNWPDDESNSRKPRYSAETGNRLLRNKNIDLDNLRNDYIKLKEQLATITQERDDATNKLRNETTRSTSLEKELLRGKEEVARGNDDRTNLEAELVIAAAKCKEAELEQRNLQQQLEDLSAKQTAGDQRNKIQELERKLRTLQAENYRLSNVPERPSSRTSSIPVPKARRPSESKSPRLEEDLRTCRAELADEKAKVKKFEARTRKAEEDAMRLQNEKTADSRKAQSRIQELQTALQEAKEDVEMLRTEVKSPSSGNVDTSTLDKLSRDRASALEQLETVKQDKMELERRLARKTAQCETLQEKLDDCLYPAGDEALKQELVIAQAEASQAKQELAKLKENMEELADRRDSLFQSRYELQDRDRKIQSLEETLKRRESCFADVQVQEDRITRLIDEKETVKDELRRTQQHNRYVESQLSFRQQELTHAQTQVKELETALSKARALNSQQQDLYSEVVKSCNIAEKRVADVERELAEIRDEMADRSTVSEVQERNRQWQQALERVGELERQLDTHPDDDPSTSKASGIPLPPVLTFADESEMDAVASLVIRLQRVREERDALRNSIEFLKLELLAKDAAFEHQQEGQRSQLLRLLQSAEQDIMQLRKDITACERSLQQSQQECSSAEERSLAELHRTQTMSTATLVALQRAHDQLELDCQASVDGTAQLQTQLQEEKGAFLKTIEELKIQLKERDDSLATLNDQYSGLNRDTREKNRTLHELQDKLDNFEEERRRLQEMFEEQGGNVRVLEREMDARNLEYQRLEEAHTIAREELYEARQEADQLRNDHMRELGEEDPEAKNTLERHIEELDGRIVRRNEQIGIQQNDIRRLDMNLRIAESTVDELRTEVDELRRQVGWLEDDASNVRHERNSAQKELESTRHELDSAQNSITKQEALLQSIEDARLAEIATLVEVISTSCVQIRLTTADLVEADAKVEELQHLLEEGQGHPTQTDAQFRELEEARRTIETLSASLQQESQHKVGDSGRTEQLQQALKEAVARGDALAEQMRRSTELARDEVKERMLSLEDQVASLSGEVESLEERLGEAQQQIEVVLNQNGDLTNQIYDLEASAETASKEHQEKVDELEGTIRGLQAEIEEAQDGTEAANQASVQELQALKLQLSEALVAAKNAEELKSRAEKLQQEKVGLTDQISQLSATINERKMELEGLLRRIAEIDDLKRDLLLKSESLQQTELERSQLEQELKALRVDMEHVQQQMSGKTAALQQCQETLADASKQVEALRIDVSSLEASSAKMERELYEAQQAASAAASTTVRDAEADVRILQLETIIARMKEEIKELERVLTHKTQEIDDHDDRHIEMLKERKKLVAKVDSLNRKIRMMQKQLDVATGLSPSDDLPLSESVTGSVTVSVAPIHLVQPSPVSVHAPPTYLQPRLSSDSARSSTLSRRSPAPLPPPVYEQVAPVHLPQPLSTSAPPAPLSSAATSATPLRSHPVSTSLPPSQAPSLPQLQTTPPHRAPSPHRQDSSSRKRRLPDDFDPSPESQMPAMPVLSTTPGRLRKVLRDGPLPRTGFTPSRSRKNSAAALDKELTNAAVAAVATLNITAQPKPVHISEKLSLAALDAKPRTTFTARSVMRGLETDVPKTQPVSDITNTPKLAKFTSQISLEPALRVDAAPAVRKYKGGGWLNRPKGVSSSKTATSGTTRRRLIDEPELGSIVIPRRAPVEVRQYPRELS